MKVKAKKDGEPRSKASARHCVGICNPPKIVSGATCRHHGPDNCQVVRNASYARPRLSFSPTTITDGPLDILYRGLRKRRIFLAIVIDCAAGLCDVEELDLGEWCSITFSLSAFVFGWANGPQTLLLIISSTLSSCPLPRRTTLD